MACFVWCETCDRWTKWESEADISSWPTKLRWKCSKCGRREGGLAMNRRQKNYVTTWHYRGV